MDDPSTRRRQHGQHVQRTSSPRFALQEQPQQSRSLGGDVDRHRSSLLSSSSSTPRGMGAGGYSTYYQEPSGGFTTASMPTAAMGYGSEYSQDGRQSSQGFGGYNTATMMYNVPQAGAQGPVYDAQQYGSRQPPSTMQLMTPDVASTYFSSETGSGSASAMQPPNQSGAATTNVFQQTTPSMSYASNISGVSGVQQTPGSGGASVTDDNDYPDGALEEKWLNYQRQLGSIFQDIARGSLETASETLLSISKWLLPQVVDLGLSLDDSSLHADRIKLWNDFNHAWLALGHRQRELMISNQPPPPSQHLMSHETLTKLGSELVHLCDGLEQHGLVDYQYGVWEEQIESVFEDCLDLFEQDTDAASGRNR
ncbi:hypothetical protein S7711_07648 [Stachybotrys chartarum IBT 7711]|uniref:Uncharacterized protein n=1 Tax=Stachybotrys chartarum (strain CBS 109288 / IBT 7711) TaxID=1280523 RepID=A0A084ALL2_STACB|nr:hypothetical protein S7711_07648 [Stachybotrys chartarum IBT 7711]KFA47038.1 hypothetical protein S40293_04645 [Stachybotrys chartarum IBT 40293]